MHSAFVADTLGVRKFAVPTFTADGSRLVAPEGGTGTPEISALLDTATGRVVRRFKLGQLAPLRPDGTISLNRFNSFAIDRFDPATGALLAQDTNSAPAKEADDSLKDSNNFTVDPSGRRIFAQFDSPPRAQLFDARTGKAVATLDVPGGKLDATRFSALGDTLVGNIGNNRIAAWDAMSGALLGTATLQGYTDEIQISRDGSHLTLRSGDGADAAPIEVVTLRPKVAVTRLQQRRFGAKAIAISNSGRLIAIGFEDGSLGMFTRREKSDTDYNWEIVPQGTSSPIVALALSEQPAILAAGDEAGVIRIWNLQDQVPIVFARLPNPAAHIVLSSDAENAAVLDIHGDLHILSLHGRWGGKAPAADVIAVGRAQSGPATPAIAASGLQPASVAKAPAAAVPNNGPDIALPPQMPLGPRAATLAACDRLAAAPDDRDRQAQPVPSRQLDAKAAVAACRQAVADTPKDRLSLFQLGRSLESGGKLDEAKSIYRQAADFGHAAAARHLALLLAKNGASADSAAMMERAVALGDPPALLQRAVALAKTGSAPDAAAAVRHAVAASAKTPAQSSALIGAILASGAADDTARSRSLFFLELARSLAEQPRPGIAAAQAGTDERAATSGGMSALVNINRAQWQDEIRGILARMLPPRSVAEIQRAAFAALASAAEQPAPSAPAEVSATAPR